MAIDAHRPNLKPTVEIDASTVLQIFKKLDAVYAEDFQQSDNSSNVKYSVCFIYPKYSFVKYFVLSHATIDYFAGNGAVSVR